MPLLWRLQLKKGDLLRSHDYIPLSAGTLVRELIREEQLAIAIKASVDKALEEGTAWWQVSFSIALQLVCPFFKLFSCFIFKGHFDIYTSIILSAGARFWGSQAELS